VQIKAIKFRRYERKDEFCDHGGLAIVPEEDALECAGEEGCILDAGANR